MSTQFVCSHILSIVSLQLPTTHAYMHESEVRMQIEGSWLYSTSLARPAVDSANAAQPSSFPD